MMTGVVQIANQLVSIKVFMCIEDMPDQHAPGLGELLAADFEELAEFLDR